MEKTVFDVKLETLISELDKSTDPEKLAAAYHLKRLAVLLLCSRLSLLKLVKPELATLLLLFFSPRVEDMKETIPEGPDYIYDILYALQILGYEKEHKELSIGIPPRKQNNPR